MPHLLAEECHSKEIRRRIFVSSLNSSFFPDVTQNKEAVRACNIKRTIEPFPSLPQHMGSFQKCSTEHRTIFYVFLRSNECPPPPPPVIPFKISFFYDRLLDLRPIRIFPQYQIIEVNFNILGRKAIPSA